MKITCFYVKIITNKKTRKSKKEEGIYMGIFDFFKKNNNTYIKDENRYTGLIRYYECKINKDNATARSIEKCPKNVDIKELKIGDDIHPIFKEAISKCNMEFYENAYNLDGFFSMETLYRLNDLESVSSVKKAYDNYISLKNRIDNKCQSCGVVTENNEQKAYETILGRIDEELKRESKKRGFEISSDVDFCQTEKSINNELENQLRGKNDMRKFTQARFELADYFSCFIEQLPWLLNILKKETLTENEKIVLGRYAETFEAIPKIVKTIDYLDLCAEKLEKENNRRIRERNITRGSKQIETNDFKA